MSGIWEPKTLPGSSPGLVNFLESPKLPEPGQSESNLGPLQPVTAHESFDAHPLESGALERHLHEPSDDGVAIESSMPPLIQIGMLRKSAPGLVGLCRRTQPVVVDSAEIETADVHRSRPGQHPHPAHRSALRRQTFPQTRPATSRPEAILCAQLPTSRPTCPGATVWNPGAFL
jgi:hypothetical protein